MIKRFVKWKREDWESESVVIKLSIWITESGTMEGQVYFNLKSN